jgi:hypothetical protein
VVSADLAPGMKFLLFFFVPTVLVLGSRAPDTAPNLPEGWCSDLKYGTPTRSTGECICKYACSGNGCRREHGLNWYEYKSCPTCKCIAGDKSGASSQKKQAEIEDSIPAEGTFPEEQEEQELKDESTIFDLLEENSREIFAGAVTLVVFALAVVIVLGRAA